MDSLSHPALLLVDGVSSIGGLDFQMDQWKVDMAVTGSQKALSLPTGLAVVAASPKVGPATCAAPACCRPQGFAGHSPLSAHRRALADRPIAMAARQSECNTLLQAACHCILLVGMDCSSGLSPKLMSVQHLQPWQPSAVFEASFQVC